MGTLLLIMTVVLVLNPPLAALLTQVIFFVPALVALGVVAVSMFMELIRTGSVDYKSRSLGFDIPLVFKEVKHGDRPAEPAEEPAE